MTQLGEIRGVEAATTALARRLTDDLPAVIDEINASHPDDEVVPQAEEILDYMPNLGGLLTFPTVAIGHGPGTWTDDTGFSATGTYDLLIVAFVQHADQRILAQHVRRYQLALLRTVLTNSRNLGTGDGIPWSIVVKAMDFGPSLGQQPGADEPFTAFLTWTALSITCKLDED